MNKQTIRLTLPYPPSVNNYWKSFRGRVVLGKDGRNFKASVKKIGAGCEPIRGPVKVTVIAYRPRKRGDLDNILKATLDSLIGVAFEDDSQVETIVARRLDDKNNPRAEVTVESLDTRIAVL